MSAKAACCFVENGNPCDCGGVYRVTLDQLERTVAAKRAKKQPELLYDYFVTCDDEEYWVCAEHAYDVIKAHLRETYEVAKGKARMERRDLIKEVLWCTGTHENQDPDAAEKLAAHIVESNAPPKPDTPRRVSRPTGDHPVVGDDKVMKLLKRVDAKGRARAFQVGKVFLVDGSAAWMLDCVGKLDAPTVICRQHPEKAVLELDVLSKETYTVSFDSIYAISWDLRHDSTPQDKDGVVVITLAIVSSGLLQILALELVKKDVNTCRMLISPRTSALQTIESSSCGEGILHIRNVSTLAASRS